MSGVVEWYRSGGAPPVIQRTRRRRMRDAIRACLPEPRVDGRTLVIHSRRTFPKFSGGAWRSDFHGLFSEFHSVLGALAWARAGGAAAVRVAFDSPLYVDRDCGRNWWDAFFERTVMPLGATSASAGDVHLDGIITKYGRFGGFSDLVQGSTPYLYPMTFGIDRRVLHGLVRDHTPLRASLLAEAARLSAEIRGDAPFVVGVHYRGTDAVHRWTGVFRHYRVGSIPFAAYAAEVRRAADAASHSRFRVFVATDESAFLEFMRCEFPSQVVAIDAPRAAAGGPAVHLDRAPRGAAAYGKGTSAIIDALLLASTDYLVKNRSNLSDASLVFNPELPYSFCPDLRIGPGG